MTIPDINSDQKNDSERRTPWSPPELTVLDAVEHTEAGVGAGGDNLNLAS